METLLCLILSQKTKNETVMEERIKKEKDMDLMRHDLQL